MTTDKLEYYKFMINERPFCYWGLDLANQNSEFLEGIDTDYFVYLADAHLKMLEGDHKLRAALAIRTAYSQALETFFSFLGAGIQAPKAVPIWLAKYTNAELDDFVNKIRLSKPIYSIFGYKTVSWEHISFTFHRNLILEDKEKERTIKASFAKLWSQLAQDFANNNFKKEYNSIKHGLRVKPGGFSLMMGLEERPGTPAPQESMHLLGHSDFGSKFPVVHSISNDKNYKHHVQLGNCVVNWSPEDLIYGLRVISCSMENIVSYLKIMNSVNPKDVVFNWFSREDTLSVPWKNRGSIVVSGFSWKSPVIEEDDINKLTKEEITDFYKSTKDL